MSQWTRIKTKITEKEPLFKALNDLGYHYEEGDLEIGGFLGEKTKVDIKIPLKGSYDIGFRKSGDAYILVADWWGVHGIKQKDFLTQLTQRYAYHAASARLQDQGFILIREETKREWANSSNFTEDGLGEPMDLQEIEVVIDKNGSVQIHIRGVKGTACLQLTQELEKSLGGEVIERQLTPEYHEEPDTTSVKFIQTKQQ